MSTRRYRLPQPLGEIVERELARVGGRPASSSLTRLVARWPEAVGATIARNAWPARVSRDGTVVVHAASSVWAQELTQLEATICKRLGEDAPGRLRFVTGPLPAPGVESEKALRKEIHEPTARDRDLARQLTAEIEQPSLREAIARAASLSLAAAAAGVGATEPSDTLPYG